MKLLKLISIHGLGNIKMGGINMNKKVKIICTCLLMIGSLSIYSPVDSKLITTKAYAEASTYSLADDGELKSLDVQSADGQSLELCDAYGGDQKSLTDSKEYYVLLDGKSDGVKISAEVQGDGYLAKVFDTSGDAATAHDLGEEIPILPGQTTMYIRTYATEEGFKKSVKDKEASLCANTYKINIRKPTADESEDVGLEMLTLDSGKIPINFNRDTLTYNISVNEDQDDVEIKVRAENDKNDVQIAGYNVDEDNRYKKDLHLSYGLNTIKIVVTGSDYRVKTYTLNITKGNSANNNNSTVPSNQVASNNQLKFNQWVQVNGGWQYNDSTGKPLKNTWFYDKKYDKSYYLRDEGIMATSWTYNNGNWYYLGQDGGMKTGWQNVDGEWYYLDSNGIMKTGWIKDFSGKYYYLQTDGVMAKNTKINGYELGNDGAWIK
jgi:glucan-binding YG repeat protein